jgi:hypothetical protein
MTRTRIGLLPGLLLLLVLALAVTACSGGGGGETDGVASLGGDNATGTTRAGGGQDERQAALNWAGCMRQHGVNLPDPQINGNDILQQLPSRAEQNSAKFKAAQEACRQYQPNGRQPTPIPAEERQRALAFARCMRQHGVTNMPDPKITADGIEQQLPRGMREDDPRLRAAEQACHQYGSLGPLKAGPQGGGGGGGK